MAPFSVTFAIGGLETSLYVLLLTSTAAAALAGRRVTAALLGALALLTSHDALILLGPLVIERLIAYFSGRNDPKNMQLLGATEGSGPKNRIFYEVLAF